MRWGWPSRACRRCFAHPPPISSLRSMTVVRTFFELIRIYVVGYAEGDRIPSIMMEENDMSKKLMLIAAAIFSLSTVAMAQPAPTPAAAPTMTQSDQKPADKKADKKAAKAAKKAAKK